MQKGKKFLSDLKLYSDYFKWNENLQRYENWEEACESIMGSHYSKYGNVIKPFADSALSSMKDKAVLASQRTLQYRGDQLQKHNTRLYNCTSTYMARNRAFQEIFYLMLSGCGVGVGLLKPFVSNLSKISKRTKGTKTFIIPDTIEGWADTLGVLMSSYFVDKQPFPEYAGYEIKFDYSLIRPKGSYISGGFKAPGPDGLRSSVNKIEELINSWISTEGNEIRAILAFDILCHISNAVLSGGVRRSAMNMIVDPYDTEMINAKIGNWYSTHPHRARSNNSVILLRDLVTYEKFEEIVKMNDGISDIGFVFANSWFDMFNPCLSADSLITVKDKQNEIFQIKIKDLVDMKASGDELPLALTMNETTKELEWDIISDAFLTKTNANLIKIELSDGSTLKLTPDHKVYTENRGWIEAGKLKYDDTLIGIDE